MKRQALPTLILVALPLVVLIVPQGTVQRSLVPEAAFALFLLLGIAVALLGAPGRVRSGQLHPLLYVTLVYFLCVNPVWSLIRGNDAGRVLMTTLPFLMLALYYVFVLARFSAYQVSLLLRSVMVSAAVLALVVVANYFFGDTSGSAMRSTGIEGSRTLTLPLLPIGAVLCTTIALSDTNGKVRRWAGTAALLTLVAVAATVTRAMLLAGLVGMVASAIILARFGSRDLRRRVLVRGVLGLALLALVSIPFMPQWLGRVSPESLGDLGTILGRLDEYTAFYEAFVASPFLGQGMGHVVTYPSEFDFTLRDAGITVCHSHLFFLAGTTGVVGIVLYYACLTDAMWRMVGQARRCASDPGRLGLIAGLCGAAISGIAFTLTSTTFTTLSYNLFLAILVLASHTNWASE